MPDTLDTQPETGGSREEVAGQRKGNLGGCTGKGFLPGKSGNPNGGKKGAISLKKLLIKLLAQKYPGDKEGRKNAEVFVLSELNRALKGDKDARKMIWEYVEGMPEAQVNVNAQGGFTVVLTTKPEDNGTAP